MKDQYYIDNLPKNQNSSICHSVGTNATNIVYKQIHIQ